MMNRYLDQAPAVKATILGDLAMRRLVDPEEVADAVVFPGLHFGKLCQLTYPGR